jgi:hypothetical protein
MEADAPGEWIRFHDLAHLRSGSQDHVRVEAECLLQGLFDPLRQLCHVLRAALKHQVSALQERARICKAQRLTKPAQSIHLDRMMAAEIDGAK